VDCAHPLCELIGGSVCSITAGRSRGCTPAIASRDGPPQVFDEVRALLPAIDAGDRAAAIRLAEIVRREARDDRNLVVLARDEEPEVARALARLCLRSRS
jgi:hypothetical protein